MDAPTSLLMAAACIMPAAINPNPNPNPNPKPNPNPNPNLTLNLIVALLSSSAGHILGFEDKGWGLE